MQARRSSPTLWVICVFLTLGSAMARSACEDGGLVRPGGGDHLLYTIERSSQDIGSLQNRKFRLVVNESGARDLQIRPNKAFRVSEVARFNGSVAFSAEVIDATALYTRESWGNLPKVLTFQVRCDQSASAGTSAATKMETVPEIVPVSRPVTVPSIADSVLPPVTESSTSPEVDAYEVSNIATATLPPLPEPEPEPEPEPVPEAKPEKEPAAQPDIAMTVEQQAGAAMTRVTPAVREAAPKSLGTPVSGAGISAYEMRRVMVDLQAVSEQPATGGKARMSYALTVRNALSQSIQCDISVESSYLGSYSSDERVKVDQKVHSAVQLPARGHRDDIQGEILYYPRVLGGDKWMTQDHRNPERSGLRVSNCIPLRSAG